MTRGTSVAVILPEAADGGTANESAVADDTVVVAATPLSFACVAPAAGSKFAPVTATEVAAAPRPGVNDWIKGAPGTTTVKSRRE